MKVMTGNAFKLLILFLFYCLFNQLWAQDKPLVNEASQMIEKTFVATDREIYCVNENVLFSAFNISPKELRTAGWSNLLYVELISPSGEVFSQCKSSYSENGAFGYLKIPNNLLTGNYYLRAYTRWMRDFSPGNYFYKQITVINPFQPELLEPIGTHSEVSSILKSKVETHPFVFHSEGKIFRKRELASVEIPETVIAEFVGKMVVSVVPQGTEIKHQEVMINVPEFEFTPDYIPETRGVSISGKVVNVSDSIPIAYTLVGVTILKDHPESISVLTNANGQFFFDLSNLSGKFELFISAKPKNDQTPLILVDNDFSTATIPLPFVPVDFSDPAKRTMEELNFRNQIRTLYEQKKLIDQPPQKYSDSFFYGNADFILEFDKFIALQTVKDYFHELVPQVGVRRDGKRTSLKVLGAYPELSIYEPLVMVDMVPIFDVEKVMAISPDKISSIEVVTMPYVRGNVIFGGVISIFSRKADLAGIDLPTSGRFIVYNMLSGNKFQLDQSRVEKHVPRISNCLYWNPDLQVNENQSARIELNTGDNSGDFQLVIQGFDKDANWRIFKSDISIE